MRVEAPAKINLNLNISLERDGAGYHRAETVMAPLALCDAVEVEEVGAGGISLRCEPDPVDGPVEDRMRANIAYRAAERFCERFGLAPRHAISIEKRIPSQAGLGGGSSDAAAVLRCLALLAGVSPTCPEVVSVASSLGADVPFFLFDGPLHLVGRGDVPVERLAGFDAALALVKPGVGVSTAEAYRAFDRIAPAEVPAGPLVAALREGDWRRACLLCANNMEPASCAVAPELVDVIEFLGGFGSAIARPLLCGSGSCVALFVDDAAAAGEVAAAAARRGWWSCATRTTGDGLSGPVR